MVEGAFGATSYSAAVRAVAWIRAAALPTASIIDRASWRDRWLRPASA